MDMRELFSSFGALGGFGAAEDDSEVLAAPQPAPPVDEPPPSPVGQDERRMQVRAYNYWASLLGERNYPAIEDLEPQDLPDFGPYSVLLDFGHGIDNPSVAFLGERLAVECGADTSIGRLGDVPSLSLLSRITDHYMQILANQAPIGFEAEFVNGRGVTVLYRGILLPFSSDDDTIDFIYGVINWKELADQQTADALLLELEQNLAAAELDGSQPVDPAPRELVRAEADAPLELDAAVELEADEVWLDEVDRAEDERGEDDEETEWSIAPDEEQDDEDLRDDAASLIAMRLDRTERRKAAAVLTLDAAAQAPMVRQVVNGPAAFYQEDVADHTQAFADAGQSVSTVTIDTEPAVSSLGGLVPVPADGTGRGSLPAVRPHAPVQTETPAAMLQRIAAAMETNEEATGLHDCLASARELADLLRGTEDRSRSALYRAVSRAYDVSLAAAEAPDDFAELLEDNGLVAQDRAPMIPIVKLVFGADYDKTRLTEYATVLTHAKRTGVERGGLRQVLQRCEGGLKGIVAAERAYRRGAVGLPAQAGLGNALADRLRAMAAIDLDGIAADGPEFALVMVRRSGQGAPDVLGEVPEDTGLLSKAARHLLR